MSQSSVRRKALDKAFVLKWRLGGWRRDYQNHLSNLKSAEDAVERLRQSSADNETIKAAEQFLKSVEKRVEKEHYRILDAGKEMRRLRKIAFSDKPMKHKKQQKKRCKHKVMIKQEPVL